MSKETILAKVRTMAKVTSKLQVTIPKRIAERFGISPGDNIEFVAAGDSISIRPAGRHPAVNLSPAERLRLFRVARPPESTERGIEAHPAQQTAHEAGRAKNCTTRAKPR